MKVLEAEAAAGHTPPFSVLVTLGKCHASRRDRFSTKDYEGMNNSSTVICGVLLARQLKQVLGHTCYFLLHNRLTETPHFFSYSLLYA